MRDYVVSIMCLILILGCGRTAPLDNVQQPTMHASCATAPLLAVPPGSMFAVPLPPGIEGLPMPGNAAPVRESALLREAISAALDRVGQLMFASPQMTTGTGVYEWRGVVPTEELTWRLQATATISTSQDPCPTDWTFRLEARPVAALDAAAWTLVAQGKREIPGGDSGQGAGWISVDWNTACMEIDASACASAIGLSTIWAAYSRLEGGIQVDARATNRNQSQWGLITDDISIHSTLDATETGLFEVTKSENISWSTDSWNNQRFPYMLRWTANGAGRGDFHYLRFLAYPTWEPTLTVRCWDAGMQIVYQTQTGYPSQGDRALCAFQ